MTESLNAKLESELNGSRKSLRQVCEDLGIEIPAYVNLEQCSHCSVWGKKLKEDLDGMPICNFCISYYGE